MSKIRISILLCCILLVTACSLPALTLTQSATPNVAQTVDAARTESALTVTAGMHSLPTETFVPPTDTAEPTMTPVNTDTPQPSLTPTELPTATATFTPTVTLTASITPTASRTPVTGPTPKIDIVGVEKNKAVSFRTANFPANQIFTIRIGPYSEYSKNNKVVGTIHSGAGGSINVTVNIPGEYADIERFTIRLDSNLGYYAFNTFDNKTSGTLYSTSTPVASNKCEVSVSPSLYTVFPASADFDAVWEVKNTGDTAWNKSEVDYKYESGTEMQKYGKLFDLTDTVDPGEKIKIIVDMVAPNTAGTYSTNWVIVRGGTIVCSLPVKIVVK